MKLSKSPEPSKITEPLIEEETDPEDEKMPKKMKLQIDAEKEKYCTIRLGKQMYKQIRNREISGTIRKPEFFQQTTNSLHQRDLKAHTGCVNAVDFSPGEEFIASGIKQKLIFI
jgi:hypothetical protein